MRLVVILLLAAVTATTNAQSEPGNWTGWLGPQHNGWVSDVQPPEAWPQKLQQEWQVDVGTGYGSPLVVDGVVFLHARQGEEEVLWCLDLDSGELKWRQSYPVPFKIGNGGERHGKGPKSSPVYADGRVFTMCITGDLTAWDANDGSRLWRTDYGSRFDKNQPFWGVSTSPIVEQDRVVVHFGNDDTGALVALEAGTGKEIWSHGKDGPSYSSPLVVDIEGVKQVIDWNHRALVGVDYSTGQFLWEFPFPHIGSDQNMPTPVFHQGQVLLSGENRPLHCLQPQRDGDQWAVRTRWTQNEVALNMSTAVVNGDLLYGFSHYDSGRLFCLELANGKIRWFGPPRTGDNVLFLAMPGYIAAQISDGRLKIVEANDEWYKEVVSYRVAPSDTYAPPVFVDSGFLVKDKRHLTFWSVGK